MGPCTTRGRCWNELIEAAAGAMNWTAEWYTLRRGTTVEQIADQAVSIVMHGLAAPPKAKPKRAPIRRG